MAARVKFPAALESALAPSPDSRQALLPTGALNPGDARATQAHAEFATAYADFAGLASPPDNNLSRTDLGRLKEINVIRH